jgi:hypothetical protein
VPTYLTRRQVAERFPISHTLAKLAANGRGPRFYKPTDKVLYRLDDIEAWIEAAIIIPMETAPPKVSGGRGKAGRPQHQKLRDIVAAKASAGTSHRLKSLPPSPYSSLLKVNTTDGHDD